MAKREIPKIQVQSRNQLGSDNARASGNSDGHFESRVLDRCRRRANQPERRGDR